MPKSPTILGGKGFASGDSLSLDVIKSLVCAGQGEGMTTTLLALGWRKKLSGVIVLNLSNDNERVERGSFSIAGEYLSKDPIQFQAKKLWPEADEDVYLSLDLSSTDFLSFLQTLVSDYIDSEVLVHSFILKDNDTQEVIPAADFVEYGIRGFCIRGYIVPTASYARLHLLLYPESKTSILAHALGENPKWPGFLLWEGQFNLFPASSLKKLKWGCPILPLVIPGASLDVLATFPPELEMLSAITALMRSAIVPHTFKSGTELRAKYASLDSDGAGSLDNGGLISIWPRPRASELRADPG